MLIRRVAANGSLKRFYSRRKPKIQGYGQRTQESYCRVPKQESQQGRFKSPEEFSM